MTSDRDDADRLIATICQWDQVVVALSGGVDSSVVAAAAVRARPGKAIAVTADSPSVARWQLETAVRIANELSIEHHIVETSEVDKEPYRRNDRNRCFHCKQTLYDALDAIAQRFPAATLLSGTNADDLSDHRPGIQAGHAAGVCTPLADLGFGKQTVRNIASHFGLTNADLPASPCLASRIAYGTEVTPERLAMIEAAESWLRERGFFEFRVRLHADGLARIEVPREQLSRLIALDEHGNVSDAMRELGFRYVTVDLQGFVSGSMNRVVVPLHTGDKLPTSAENRR